jgi:hypothetical protein
MTPHDERDPLAELLSGVAIPPGDPVRREAIFAQTRGVLWRRRMVRRGTWVATLTACYVVGALSVLAWQSARPQDRLAGQPSDVQREAPEAPPENVQPPAEEPTPDKLQPALAQAPVPEDSLTTFEKLRRAGDRQLNERGNLQGAIGCYRRALDFASDDDLQIVPERDSWLLIPLKEARLETRKHVHKKS